MSVYYYTLNIIIVYDYAGAIENGNVIGCTLRETYRIFTGKTAFGVKAEQENQTIVMRLYEECKYNANKQLTPSLGNMD